MTKKETGTAHQKWWNTDTRFKFDEARYFYEKLIQLHKRANKNYSKGDIERVKDNDFLFLIDAFLTAFTSIFYVMQNEYDKKNDKIFESWFKQKVGVSDKKNRLVYHDPKIAKVVSARHLTIHEGQYQPIFGQDFARDDYGPFGRFIIFDPSDNSTVSDEIQDIFKEALDSAEKLISECESKFS